MIHLIHLVGLKKLMLVMIRFKESYASFRITLVFLKFQLNKRFSFQHVAEAIVRKVVKKFSSDEPSACEIPIKILRVNFVFSN